MPTSVEMVMELAKEVARLEAHCKELEVLYREKDEALNELIHVLATYAPAQPDTTEQP